MSEDDKNELRKRVVDRHLGDYPRDAVHLFAEKAGVYEHNGNTMNHMEVEKVVIPCHDTVVSANISSKKAQELISQVRDDASITANLERFLTVVVGMKYVMSVNVNVEDGLTNRATGVVKFVEYKIEGSNRPSIIWMKTDDPRIGKATREKYFQRAFLIQIFKETGLLYLKLKELMFTDLKCIRGYNSLREEQQQKQSTKLSGSQKMK